MSSLAEFLKTGRYGAFSCGFPRNQLLSVVPMEPVRQVFENEESLQWGCFTAYFNRGPAVPVEDGKLAGIGLYFSWGDVLPKEMAIDDFNLFPPVQFPKLSEFMMLQDIGFNTGSGFSVTAGGVLILHDGQTIASLIRPCFGTAFWKQLVYVQADAEKWLKECESNNPLR